MSRTFKDTPWRKLEDGQLRWPGQAAGKSCKRRLNRCRRQVVASLIGEELEEGRPHLRGWLGAEAEANWKTW